MNEIYISDEQIEQHILRVVYENRGSKKSLNSTRIRKQLPFEISRKAVQYHLSNLAERKLVRTYNGPSQKLNGVSYPATTYYEISVEGLKNFNSDSTVPAVFKEAIDIHDSEYIKRTWQKAIDKVDSDPEGAITAARTLIESLCKHILKEKNGDIDYKGDLPKLVKAVIGLLPPAGNEKAHESIKEMLRGFTTTVNGLASLRNEWGDSHGKDQEYIGPPSSVALLAVNSAGTLATFLVSIKFG